MENCVQRATNNPELSGESFPRTPQDIGRARSREARLAERRDYEPRSGEGVWGANVPPSPTLLTWCFLERNSV
ncbi:MAG: hypothetical protein ABSF90_31480 [Syntrophobacteraceae bacterium]|jgi:hypothetical protein